MKKKDDDEEEEEEEKRKREIRVFCFLKNIPNLRG